MAYQSKSKKSSVKKLKAARRNKGPGDDIKQRREKKLQVEEARKLGVLSPHKAAAAEAQLREEDALDEAGGRRQLRHRPVHRLVPPRSPPLP